MAKATKKKPLNSSAKMRKTPGSVWRVLAHEQDAHGGASIAMENQGIFDEVVVDNWLHVEQMDSRIWWMRVGNSEEGDWTLWVTIGKDGRAKVSVEQDV